MKSLSRFTSLKRGVNNNGAISEYAELEETFAPVALQTIGDWIVAHTTAPARN